MYDFRPTLLFVYLVERIELRVHLITKAYLKYFPGGREAK
jgi:hypothetical protein